MACSAAPGLRRHMRAFRRDEDGSLLVFGLVLFAIFFLMGGVAIDVMRAENRRVALAQTLDRCALNAAALSQTLNPEAVLRDCVERDGLLPFLTSVQVTNQNDTRAVAATGRVPVSTLFMDSLGIDTLPMNASTRAAQGASNIEIVLALDISNSMNSANRLQGLRQAAKNFVSSVLASNGDRISIAIVPYSTQVNLPPVLAAQYNLTPRSNLGVTANGDMNNVNCVDLPSSVFSTPGLSPTQPFPPTGFADLSNIFSGPMFADTFFRATRDPITVSCRPLTNTFIRLPDNDVTRLHAQIDALRAFGNTSINLGMKWASVMLDPQTRPVFDALIREGAIPAEFRGRPSDYNVSTQKIIVLMTDGENTPDNRLNDPFRSGPSPIFVGTDGMVSIRHTTGRPDSAGTNEFWVPHLDPDGNAGNGVQGEWRATPWGGTPETTGTQMTWPEVWQRLSAQWTAWQLYARPLGTSATDRQALFAAQMNTFQTRRGTSTSVGGVTTFDTPILDEELRQICSAVKAQNVLVYGIAFSAPERGINTIRDCASSSAHFFVSTDNASLAAAFGAIAVNITQLRLTQ